EAFEMAQSGLLLQIPVEQTASMIAQASPVEIHKQECDAVKHIDDGKPLVELEGIEEGGAIFEENDVPQMHVAVAAADKAVAGALPHERGGFAQCLARGYSILS